MTRNVCFGSCGSLFCSAVFFSCLFQLSFSIAFALYYPIVIHFLIYFLTLVLNRRYIQYQCGRLATSMESNLSLFDWSDPRATRHTLYATAAFMFVSLLVPLSAELAVIIALAFVWNSAPLLGKRTSFYSL
jgi:TctA family transporter